MLYSAGGKGTQSIDCKLLQYQFKILFARNLLIHLLMSSAEEPWVQEIYVGFA